MLLQLFLLASAQALPIDHGSSPTVLQYVLEAVVGLPEWNRYLPDDIDVDHDGNLNEKEVELKFKSYVKDVFDQLDKDADKLVSQEEFRNASINLIGINKIIDIAMQSFPIKKFLRFGDRNQDGFIDEDDFLIPENWQKLLYEYYKEKFGDKFYDRWVVTDQERVSGTKWTLKASVPAFKENSWSDGKLICSENFSQKEAQVLCKEMGYLGVQSLTSISFDDYKSAIGERKYGYTDLYEFKFKCQGTESTLEKCQKVPDDDAIYGRCPSRKELLASVQCSLNKEIGKVELAGGKDGSSGDLHIGLEKYCGDISPDMAKVVCRELGVNPILARNPLVTRNNFFTYDSGPPNIGRKFQCNGSEQKLQDCQAVPSTNEFGTRCVRKSNGIVCKPVEPLWDKYGKPLGERSQNPGDYNDGKSGFYNVWEKYGRNLFVADTNDDHKASMEELRNKIKDIVVSVFHVLDQTDDGVFSASDLTTLNVSQPDVDGLIKKLFQILAKGEQQIDLYNLNVPLLVQGTLGNLDYNQDKIINLKDFSLFMDSSQMEGLATIFIKEVDPNQDGIITVTELDNYVKAIFNHLGGGTVTLDTLWKLMKESQVSCLQIHGIRTFVEAAKGTIATQLKKLLDYFFRELDLNDNGEIPLEELYNAHVPCDEVNDHANPRFNGDRIGCGRLMDALIYPDMPPKAPSLGAPDRGPPGRIEEKLANAACIAMQPDL